MEICPGGERHWWGEHLQLGEVALFNIFIYDLEEGGNHTLIKTWSNTKLEGVASISKNKKKKIMQIQLKKLDMSAKNNQVKFSLIMYKQIH